MERSREFLIPPQRVMDHAMELAVLLESHGGMCKWLGPYEGDEQDEDPMAQYYKRYFEERLGYLVLTLSMLLRTLDDRGLIGDYTRGEEARQVDLGKVFVDGRWEDLADLRTALNSVLHA